MDLERCITDLVEQGKTWDINSFEKKTSKDSEGVVHISRVPPSEFRSWVARAQDLVVSVTGPDSSAARLADRADKRISYSWEQSNLQGARDDLLAVLNSVLAGVRSGQYGTGTQSAPHAGIEHVRLVCNRFHSVACELRDRYAQRETLDVADEYDVQDVLRSLLSIYFDDIRPEDPTPRLAARSGRVDFNLAGTGIVVEAKKTRKGLADKELDVELFEDVARYRERPDFRHMV